MGGTKSSARAVNEYSPYVTCGPTTGTYWARYTIIGYSLSWLQMLEFYTFIARSFHPVVAILREHWRLKIPRSPASSARKLHIWHPYNRTEPTAAQYTRLFKVSEISSRRRKYFSPVYAARALSISVLTSTAVLSPFVTVVDVGEVVGSSPPLVSRSEPLMSNLVTATYTSKEQSMSQMKLLVLWVCLVALVSHIRKTTWAICVI